MKPHRDPVTTCPACRPSFARALLVVAATVLAVLVSMVVG